ncbi:MAG: choice-of-anchor Q domain-containing protein, partial [Ardenticatenales bacterium]
MTRRFALSLAAGVLALTASIRPPAAVRADAVVGSGTAASCTESALDAALLAGGRVRFDCGAAPKVIVITAIKNIARDTVLEGDDLIVLSGEDKVGLVRVAAGVAFGLNHMTLTAGHGGSDGGGALFNAGGTVVLDHSTLQDSTADGVAGALVSRGGSVVLSDSEVRGNKGPAAGAIFSTGTLDVLRSTMHDNIAVASGGAMQVYGAVTIRDSTFERNRADEGDGGALYVAKTGRVAMFGTRLSDNGTVAENRYGGGIASSGAVTITDSTLIHNYAYQGGGIRNDHGSLALMGVTLAANAAYGGGGILNDGGAVTLIDSTFEEDRALLAGGGMANNGGTASLDRVTISHCLVGDETHLTSGGGGLYVGSGAVDLTNVTLSGNSAGYGGALFSQDGSTTLGNATLIDNASTVAGDAVYRNGGLVVLRGSILAGRLPMAVRTDIGTVRQQALCGGAITSLGYNLAEDTSCQLNKTGDHDADPALLGPLADNGGPTLTHLPRPDSLAIDTGAPVGCPATDQRGVPRPYGARCDKGAVEYVAPPTATATATATATLPSTVPPSATATSSSPDVPSATPSPSVSPTVSASATTETGPTDVSPSPTATVGPPSPTGPSPVGSETATPTRSTSPTAASTSQPSPSAMSTATVPTGETA